MYSDIPAFLITVVAILVLVALVASFLWAGAAFKGRKRTITMIAVAAFWVGAYWLEGGGREKLRYRWEADAKEACVADIDNAHESLDVDGLLDENTLLTPESVLHLFLQNKLGFVELRVGKSANRNDAMYFGDGYVWQRSETENIYAKLELSKKGDAKCIQLPKGTAGSESRVPFLPDTCVRASFSDKPTARYSFEFAPAKYSDWPFLSRYGAWSIIDKQSNRKLATAATHLQKTAPIELFAPYKLLRLDPATYYNDNRLCVFGSGLLSRVRSIRSSDLSNSRFLVPKRLSIQDPTRDQDDADIPIIQPKYLVKEYPTRKDSAPDFYERAWRDAVVLAQKNGWSSYGHYDGKYIIHWGARELIGLNMPSSSREYSWREYPIEDGFILLSHPSFDAKPKCESRVLRYTSDGRLVWSAKVILSRENVGQCQIIWADSVFIEGEDLVLTTNFARDERGFQLRPVWAIPLSSLPGSLN